ncbi:unnamed protein product [Rhizoctonia solani]|uniref:Uncharacterized protein n=1 Tax=Rhizoctonia solani TaxID=456999 RepID=A0A8H3BUA4_9AGAM|nr:unnamed protein product [Rhizoctonia solani]
MQLRKDHEAPFYHEFVVFRLDNNGGTFRIDRRQLPNEVRPLDCIYEQGVEAYDTLQKVNSMNDSLFSSSSCIISLDLRVRVHLWVVLKSCWAIHNHPSAWVYTIQRYNCFFFSRSISMNTAYSVPKEESILAKNRTTLKSFNFLYDWDDMMLRFREHDGDLHVWGIMHDQYCTGPDGKNEEEVKLPYAGDIRPRRLPRWASSALLMFQASMGRFWQDAFLDVIQILLVTVSKRFKNKNRTITGHLLGEMVHGVFESQIDLIDDAWWVHCKAQLWLLDKKFKSMIKKALNCPSLRLSLTTQHGRTQNKKSCGAILCQ